MIALPSKTAAVRLGLAGILGLAFAAFAAESKKQWEIHDMNRPRPQVITPGTPSTADQPGRPPSDAVVLFDGHDLSHWEGANHAPAAWKVEAGYMEAAKGSINTKEAFGDCQLHVEWMSPNPPRGSGQDRGNSGIFLMSRYELQVLDSFGNDTYPDGQAGSVYGQYPPLVNASRPAGQWQTYDVVFHGPHFNPDGSVAKPARITVIQNGVLVQDNSEIKGATAHKQVPKYSPHPEAMPISLQDHNHPVRFRNIWIRPLPPEEARP